MESVCLKPIFVCMFVFCVCPCVSSLLLPPGFGLQCAFVGWASGFKSVTPGSIRGVSFLALILCALVSSVISLSFFLHLLSMPCPNLECILVWPSFLFPSWEVYCFMFSSVGDDSSSSSVPAGMQAICFLKSTDCVNSSERKSDKIGSSCLNPIPPPSTPFLLSYFKQNVGFEFGNASHYPDMSIINHVAIATSTSDWGLACLL